MITINGAHEGQHAHGRADEYEIDPAGFLHVYESPDSALGKRRIVASYAPGHWATVVVEPKSEDPQDGVLRTVKPSAGPGWVDHALRSFQPKPAPEATNLWLCPNCAGKGYYRDDVNRAGSTL